MPSKQEIIDERQANLPLPEQPPRSSDWNSSDERTMNVGPSGREDDISASRRGPETLREAATGESDIRVSGEEWKTNTAANGAGREAKDNLQGLPNDAATRETRNKASTVETRKWN
ncbi:uncharacterized protein K441DRAFT_650690 [Cenococcum geophilum 1.58]|uniref:uncharacterized protein n=1 Tax=Cenococcum geophilum 1.58 TaxID=794803 RepID=UPI00358FE4C8|nr:hypothetical protein K441DRAFT_650690 [Cenococcum geophilum 1.58]